MSILLQTQRENVQYKLMPKRCTFSLFFTSQSILKLSLPCANRWVSLYSSHLSYRTKCFDVTVSGYSSTVSPHFKEVTAHLSIWTLNICLFEDEVNTVLAAFGFRTYKILPLSLVRTQKDTCSLSYFASVHLVSNIRLIDPLNW